MISLRYCILSLVINLLIVNMVQSLPNPAKRQKIRMKTIIDEEEVDKENGKSSQKNEYKPISNRHRRQSDITFEEINNRYGYENGKLPSGYWGVEDFAFKDDEYDNNNYPQPIRQSGNFLRPNQNVQTNWQNNRRPSTTNDNFQTQQPFWQNGQRQQIPSNQGINQNLVDGSPSTNSQNQIGGTQQNSSPGTPTPCERRCHQYVTNEYNPICGSDNVTYRNPGKFRCALKCGKSITNKRMESCGFLFPSI